MDGRTFKTDLMNVAQARYFYKLGEMTERDIAFLKSMIEINKSPLIRSTAEAWVDAIQKIFQYKRHLISKGVGEHALSEFVDEASKQLGEDYQGLIERSGGKYLPLLLESSNFCISKDEEYIDFVFFVMNQYFRTSRIRENLKRNLEGALPGYVDRSMGAIIPVMSTLVASTIAGKRGSLVPYLVENKTDVNFISGDQPVINTCAADVSFNEVVGSGEFYYPISPRKAVFLSENDAYSTGEIVEPEVVRELNRKMVISAERQIFSVGESELECWKGLVGSHR